jgi:hypothetical protein
MLGTIIATITILVMGAANAANNENKTACIDPNSTNSINTWATATEATLDAYAAIVGADSTMNAQGLGITSTAYAANYEKDTACYAVADANSATTANYAMSKDATAELRPVIATKIGATVGTANYTANYVRVKDTNNAKQAMWALAVNTGKIVGATTNNANMTSLATAART